MKKKIEKIDFFDQLKGNFDIKFPIKTSFWGNFQNYRQKFAIGKFHTYLKCEGEFTKKLCQMQRGILQTA